jgi:hypothetical protein
MPVVEAAMRMMGDEADSVGLWLVNMKDRIG